MNDIYKLIASKIPEMSKTQKRLANYIIENKNVVPFLNIGKLSKLSTVSEASIVRFSTFLGFSGYPEFQQNLQASAQRQLTTTERLTLSYNVYDKEEQGLYDIFNDDINNIKESMAGIDKNTFFSVVNMIIEAKRVFIIANRSAVSLGSFLHYYLNMILGNSILVDSLSNNIELLDTLTEKDLVIGISFARYSQTTVKIMNYTKIKNCNTVAITDNILSPLVPYADKLFITETKMPTFLDSFVAPLSLINALITYVGKNKNYELEGRLERLEDTWNYFNVFN